MVTDTYGFGSHTFSMINDKNERVWVKFHLKTNKELKTSMMLKPQNGWRKSRFCTRRPL